MGGTTVIGKVVIAEIYILHVKVPYNNSVNLCDLFCCYRLPTLVQVNISTAKQYIKLPAGGQGHVFAHVIHIKVLQLQERKCFFLYWIENQIKSMLHLPSYGHNTINYWNGLSGIKNLC